MRPLLLLGCLVGTLAAQTGETGPARAARFLEAMGGREAWTRVKFVHVEAVHDDLQFARPFTNQIWNDFSAPRVRIEAKNADMERRRGMTQDDGWRWRDGRRIPLTAAQLEEEHRWWEANIYRTLHRLAVDDPDLTARAVGPHRLEIHRRDGKRLNWFVLNPRGEPMLFGTWDSETGSTFGPLASNGSIKYPKWGAMPDGSWRYEIVRLVSGPTVPSEIDFTAP